MEIEKNLNDTGTNATENGPTEQELFESVYASLQNDGEKLDELLKEPVAKDATPEPEKTEVTNVSTDPAAPGTKEQATEDPKLTKEDTAWLNSVPPELKEKVTKLIDERNAARREHKQVNHQYQSYVGRLGAYQRTIADLNNKLNQVSARPLSKELSAAKLEKDEDFQALAESDPKFAKFLERREEQLKSQLAEAFEGRIQEYIQPIVETHKREYIESQRTMLREMVPNVDEVVMSNQFKEWYFSQPEEVQSMARSDSAAAAYRALQLYYRDMIIQQHPEVMEQQHQQYQAPQQYQQYNAGPSAEELAAAKALEEARAKKTSVNPTTAATNKPLAGLKGGDIQDPQAMFNSLYKQLHPTLKR